MSKLTCILLASVCIAIGVASTNLLRAQDAATPPATQPVAEKPVNTKCPVSGEDIDPSKTVVYKGQTIAFCCPDCIKAFNKDPEKYVAKLK